MLAAFIRRHPWLAVWFACVTALAFIVVLNDFVPAISQLLTLTVFWLAIILLGIWTAIGTPLLLRQPWVSALPPDVAQRTLHTVSGEGLACFLITLGLGGCIRTWPPLAPFALPLAVPLASLATGGIVLCLGSLLWSQVTGHIKG